MSGKSAGRPDVRIILRYVIEPYRTLAECAFSREIRPQQCNAFFSIKSHVSPPEYMSRFLLLRGGSIKTSRNEITTRMGGNVYQAKEFSPLLLTERSQCILLSVTKEKI